MSKILDDLNEFCCGLRESQKILADFGNDLDDRIRSIVDKLSSLEQETIKLKQCDGGEWVRRILQRQVDTWTEAVKECTNEARNSIQGEEFRKRFEKTSLVIVFGVVKAGKSTLGNFIRGRAFRDGGFDNPYQPGGYLDMSKSPITVEKSGREDQEEKDWFDTNSIESTCSVQYFSMPGMVWVDLPGTGAPVKDTDMIPLEELAKQYVAYADLVVLLENSENPGIREDVANRDELHRLGKKVIGVITRSDTVIPKVQNGKVVKKRVAKDPERRKKQEDYSREVMEKQGIPAENIDVISISTSIAEEAVEQQDDTLWEDSHIGLFYRKIADVIGDKKILELKKMGPKKALNAAIERIVGKEGEDGKTLEGLLSMMAKIKKELDEKYKGLSENGDLRKNIQEDVVNSLRGDVNHLLGDLERQAQADKKEELSFSLADITKKVNEKLKKALNSHIKRLLDDFETENLHAVLEVGNISGQLKRGHEDHTFEYQEPVYVSREPKGVIEHICSWFGREYYRASSVTKKGTQSVDLGFDLTPVKQELLQQLEELITPFINEELDSINKQFFGTARENLSRLMEDIEKIKNELNNMRYTTGI